MQWRHVGDFLEKVEAELHLEPRVRVCHKPTGWETDDNVGGGECSSKDLEIGEFMAYSGNGRRAGSKERP